MAAWRKYWPALLLFLLGPLTYHSLLTPGMAIPNLDLLVYFRPYGDYLGNAWRHGRVLPLWNSQIYLGAPFLANIQAGVLYPPNLLFALLPSYAAIGWLLALHIGIAGAGMYLYALAGPRLRRPGSFVSGLVYMLGAHIVSQAGHVNQVETLAWVPWLMLATDRVVARPDPWRIAALGVAAALVILAGHTQQAYLAFLLATVAGAGRLWTVAIRHRRWRLAATASARLLAGAGLGAALSALQLLATLELLGRSSRSGGLSLEEASVVSVPVTGILANLLPDYVAEHSTEYAVSVGAVAILLMAIALVARWRRPRVGLWVLLGLIALVAALGPRGRLYEFLFYALPGLRLFRVPARILVFTAVAAALLSGEGVLTVQQLATVRRRRRWRRKAPALVGGAAALALLPGLALAAVAATGSARSAFLRVFPGSIRPENVALLLFLPALALTLILLAFRHPGRARSTLLGLGLPALVLADLLLLTAPTYPVNPLPDGVYRDPGPAAALVHPSNNERFLTLVPFVNDLPVDDRIPAGLTPPERDAYRYSLRIVEPLTPDLAMVDGLLTADGYDGGVLPLRSYARFRAPLLPADSTNPPDYMTALLTSHVTHPEWLQEAAVGTVIMEEGADPNPPGCQCLVRTAASGRLVAWRPVGQTVTRAHLESGAPANVVQDTGERVTVALPPGSSGRLILADTYYPGWTAAVDGRPVSIQPYHDYLRAVAIPDGAREVVFEYRPRWLLPGLGISVLSLLTTLALLIWTPLWRLRSRGSARRPSAA